MGGWGMCAHPLAQNFFILMQFLGKIGQIIGLCRSPGLALPPWEILDLPLHEKDVHIFSHFLNMGHYELQLDMRNMAYINYTREYRLKHAQARAFGDLSGVIIGRTIDTLIVRVAEISEVSRSKKNMNLQWLKSLLRY